MKVNRISIICQYCKKKFWVYPSRMRQAEKKGCAVRYCSLKCRGLGQRGKNNPKWKGGKGINRDGYVVLNGLWNHPHNSRGRFFEHRLVMEKHIGRYLESYEIVHHRNGIKDDNRIENLELLINANHPPGHSLTCPKCGYKLY